MTKPRTGFPVSSFGPELMALLLKGAHEPVELRLSWRRANYLRKRLNHLRSQMRKENHQAYELAARAKVRVIVPPGTETRRTISGNSIPKDHEAMTIVRVSPQDEEWTELIRAAGVDINSSADLTRPTPLPTSRRPVRPLEDEPIDSVLDRLMRNDDSEGEGEGPN